MLGRYSRIAYLPEGTLGNVGVIRDALSNCPENIGDGILKFQIHQESEFNFLLKLKLREGLSDSLVHYFQEAWSNSSSPEKGSLQITSVDELEAERNGKFHDFTSVFQP